MTETTTELRAVSEALLKLTVGSCSCDTKTPELKFHNAECRYRIAEEAFELLAAYTSAPTVPLSVYESAVKGRRDFRSALREARAEIAALRLRLKSEAGE